MGLSSAAQKRFIWAAVTILSVLGTILTAAAFYFGAINSRLAYLEVKMYRSYRNAKSHFEEHLTKLSVDAQFPEAHQIDLRRVLAEVSAGESSIGEGVSQITAMIKMIDPHAQDPNSIAITRTLKSALAKLHEHRQEVRELNRQFESELKEFPTSLVAAYFGFPHLDHEEQTIDLYGPVEDRGRRSKSNPFLRKK